MAVITGYEKGTPIYKPGIIYEIRHTDLENPGFTIYVGETTDLARRRKEHQKRYAQDADGNTQYVHDILDAFDADGILWDLVAVSTYDQQGPGGPEYDAIINAAMRGCTLCNIKHGNQSLADRVQTDINDMQILGIQDPADYRAWKEDARNRLKIISRSRRKEARDMKTWTKNKFATFENMPDVDATGRRRSDLEVLQCKYEYQQRMARVRELARHPGGVTVAALELLQETAKKQKLAKRLAELRIREQGDL